MLLSISRTQMSACSSRDKFADRPIRYVTGASMRSREVAGTIGTYTWSHSKGEIKHLRDSAASISLWLSENKCLSYF